MTLLDEVCPVAFGDASVEIHTIAGELEIVVDAPELERSLVFYSDADPVYEQFADEGLLGELE